MFSFFDRRKGLFWGFFGRRRPTIKPGNVPGYKNRPAGLTQQNHPESRVLIFDHLDLARYGTGVDSMELAIAFYIVISPIDYGPDI